MPSYSHSQSSPMDIPQNDRQQQNVVNSSYADYAGSFLPHSFEILRETGAAASSDSGNERAVCETERRCKLESIESLPGEIFSAEDEETFRGCFLRMTNYRLILKSDDAAAVTAVPLLSIEQIDYRDPEQVIVSCKHGIVLRLTALSRECAVNWHRRLTKHLKRDSVFESFAFDFAEAAFKEQPNWLSVGPDGFNVSQYIEDDFGRLGYDHDHFRISDINANFSMSATYPERVVVPKEVTDEDIKLMREFRVIDRFPVVVWKSQQTGAVLLRSSQPRSGLFSWRNRHDEKVFEEVVRYLDSYKQPSDESAKENMIIMDARSWAAAWANRAKGGGYEATEYYQRTSPQFLGLPNIHHVRYSFHQLRNLLTSSGDPANYLQSLQATNWLHYISQILQSSNECVDHLLDKGVPVLVHCSDGWDRTTQVVSLAKLIADDYYRTIKGFETLICCEWLAYGHKFADRNAVYGSDTYERAPIFLQFLDCVYQLMCQNPTSFEFSHQYLIKLAQHSYSGLFGTFLFNTLSDRQNAINERSKQGKQPPVSIWRYLNADNDMFVNQTYASNDQTSGRLSSVKSSLRNLNVWMEVYCCDEDMNESLQKGAPTPTVLTLLYKNTISTGKETAEVPTRSKSTESLQELKDNGMNTSICGSRQNLALESADTIIGSVYSVGSIGKKTTKEPSKKKNPAVMDPDGLIQFYDAQQEMLREKKKKEEEALRRRRQASDHTASSFRSKDGRVSMADLDDVDEMSMDGSIDVIDHNEVSPAPPVGYSCNSPTCAICKATFSTIFCQRYRCKLCLQEVCSECSQYRSALPSDKCEQARTCKTCYDRHNYSREEVVEPASLSSHRDSDSLSLMMDEMGDLSVRTLDDPSLSSATASPRCPSAAVPIASSPALSSSDSFAHIQSSPVKG